MGINDGEFNRQWVSRGVWHRMARGCHERNASRVSTPSMSSVCYWPHPARMSQLRKLSRLVSHLRKLTQIETQPIASSRRESIASAPHLFLSRSVYPRARCPARHGWL